MDIGFAVRRIRSARLLPMVVLSDIARWVAALLWFVITVFPVWWMFNIVFTESGTPVAINPRLYPSSLSAGVDNIQKIIGQFSFLRAYGVSFAFALIQIAGILLVVSMAAYEFALFKFPGRDTLFLIALTTLMVPGIVTLIPLYRLVVSLGWLNTLQGLAIPGLASSFVLFALKQYMETLPEDLLDAALIDGASHFGAYWRIALPLSKNALITMSVLIFMSAWGNYIWPLVIISKPEWYTVSLVVTHFFGPEHNSIYDVMTAAFLTSLPPILFYIFFQRRIVEGIALTGLRG
jgi:multiple sugar transport system permease protein